jgi:hypothetical protein
MLSRAPTFRDQLSGQLGSMLEAAGTAVDDMQFLLDPAKQMELLDEALTQEQCKVGAG